MKREKIFKKLKSLSASDQVKTALFTAELVLPVYESYSPNDNRVRRAIETGKTCAASAADAAVYAVYAADAAADAVYAAADAAVYAVYAASYAATDAADAAVYAVYAAAAVRQGLNAGAKKQTVYEFMKRLSAS